MQEKCKFDKEELNKYLYGRIGLFVEKVHAIEAEVLNCEKDFEIRICQGFKKMLTYPKNIVIKVSRRNKIWYIVIRFSLAKN